MDSLAAQTSTLLRKVQQRYLTARAKLRKKAFFCNALAGNSEINVCINSDLTVSCSCHDTEGLGHIGDLSHQSLEEVFSGDTARRFREELASGSLPISDCARCCDLRMIDKAKAEGFATEYSLPKYIMVENTSACNLRCLSCPRTRIRKIRSKVSMSLDDVSKVAGELKQAGIEKINYLNFGEPFLPKSVGEELKIIREVLPSVWIDTSTNGLLINTDEKREAALLVDSMQWSLDGMSRETVAKYQRNADFDESYRNMKALVEYRDAKGLDKPAIIWKYLLFRWNDRKQYVRKAIELAKQANVDRILFERTTSPFYGISLRYYLGFHNDVGEDMMGNRNVVLR